MSIVDKMSANGGVNSDGWRLFKHDDDHFWFCLGGGQTNGCVLGGPLSAVVDLQRHTGAGASALPGEFSDECSPGGRRQATQRRRVAQLQMPPPLLLDWLRVSAFALLA
jgi:hypothetical protein